MTQFLDTTGCYIFFPDGGRADGIFRLLSIVVDHIVHQKKRVGMGEEETVL